MKNKKNPMEFSFFLSYEKQFCIVHGQVFLDTKKTILTVLYSRLLGLTTAMSELLEKIMLISKNKTEIL